MKRRHFLLAAAAIPAAALAESLPVPAPKRPAKPGKGFKVSTGEGRYHGHIQLKGVNFNVLDVKLSGKDTNGQLAIFEQTSLSPKRGTPLHVHPNQDEVFQVLEGEYVFKVGDYLHRLKAGESIFLPRQVPQAWSQLSERGRTSVILQPAGKLEEFFVAMAALKTAPTPAEINKIFADHDMSVVGPALQVD